MIEQIEFLREKLEEAINEGRNLCDWKVISLSNELNKHINQYYLQTLHDKKVEKRTV